MSEYSFEVQTMECDYFRQLSPQGVLVYMLSSTLIDIHRDGCGREVIYPKLGAVWMISHMRFYQYAPIYCMDKINVRTFPRVIERGRYVFYAEAYRDGELVIRFDTSYL